MLGIYAIGCHVPPDAIDNIQQAASFERDETFVRQKLGATRLARMAPNDDTSDLAVAALEDLFQRTTLTADQVEALVVVTQNGDAQQLPHTAAIVQDKAGLPTHIAAFDVALGCSGYVYGLSILQGLMQQCGMKNAVLITADPYSKIIDPADRVTALLFGDAATATWIGEGAPWQMTPPSFGTDGSGAKHLHVKPNHTLYMNGRQVFNFTAKLVPEHIHSYLHSQQIAADSIDEYILHQGSAIIVQTIAKQFPGLEKRFICDMDMGNTISSSIPLILVSRLNNPELKRLLISGFGIGLSWGTSVLMRQHT